MTNATLALIKRLLNDETLTTAEYEDIAHGLLAVVCDPSDEDLDLIREAMYA